MSTPSSLPLEEQIAQWRGYLRRRTAVDGQDVQELEGHLRDQMAALTTAGLAGDEAFLVAVKRMGSLDALSREFAREHSERLWKQLVIGDGAAAESSGPAARSEARIAFGLALAAAAAVKVPELFGKHLIDGDMAFYNRNASFFVLPFLVVYFVWKRGASSAIGAALAGSFAAAIAFANAYPFVSVPAFAERDALRGSSTQNLTALHLPIALWLAAASRASSPSITSSSRSAGEC